MIVSLVQVKLRPRPWYARWERADLQGIQPLDLPERFYKRAKEHEKPWEQFDLMKQYKYVIISIIQQGHKFLPGYTLVVGGIWRGFKISKIPNKEPKNKTINFFLGQLMTKNVYHIGALSFIFNVYFVHFFTLPHKRIFIAHVYFRP